jgi:2-polyprenyl-6-hydroxyphenyl methylase/3-demethylubiquinone-9 3-methyltransferase
MSRTDGKVSTVIDNDFYDDLGVHGWWDVHGPQHGLHQMNPMRTGYFYERLHAEGVGVLPDKKELSAQPLIVEIGCGGGIVSEAMASYGYRVHGIDLSASSIAVAQAHSAGSTSLRGNTLKR